MATSTVHEKEKAVSHFRHQLFSTTSVWDLVGLVERAFQKDPRGSLEIIRDSALETFSSPRKIGTCYI